MCQVFTFGFAFPILFVIFAIVIFCMHVFDKLLITYWYRPQPLQTDRLNQYFLRMMLFAPLMLLLFGGVIIRNNNCALSAANQGRWKDYYKQYSYCHAQEPQSVFCFVALAVLFCTLVVVSFFWDKKQSKIVYNSNSNYFSQLSPLQQKMWIAYETYYRAELHIHLLSDR